MVTAAVATGPGGASKHLVQAPLGVSIEMQFTIKLRMRPRWVWAMASREGGSAAKALG